MAFLRWLQHGLVLASLLHILVATPVPSSDTDCLLEASGVYVAISSEGELTNGSVIRWIEIRWWGIPEVTGNDWVGLWDTDPMLNSTHVLQSANVTVVPDGRTRLDVRWDGSKFPSSLTDIPDCLPLWAGYVQDGKIIYSSCLRLQPNWMFNNQNYIAGTRLAEVLLPGTHDAGSYGALSESDPGNFVITQDESFWQQMVLGVRYVDIRIGYYPDTEEKLYLVHGSAAVRPLQSYLDDTAAFIKATNEIIIFDIHLLEHGFSGLTYDENARPILNQALETSFEGLMLPINYAPNPMLGTIWEDGRRLIVTYPEATSSSYFWPRVNHVWGDVNELDELYQYMDENIPKMFGSGFMWSAMTEFTPSAIDITFSSWGGLRGASDITNSNVTMWLRREWWQEVNIIAMDFIASSDVISTAIEGNVKRFTCLN